MPKELNVELFLVEMRLSRKDVSLDQAQRLLAVAQATVPKSIKAQFLRDKDISTVEADVDVDAAGQAALSFHGVVHVELTYKGHVMRSPRLVMAKVTHRLMELAQKHCLEAIFKELAEQVKGRQG